MAGALDHAWAMIKSKSGEAMTVVTIAIRTSVANNSSLMIPRARPMLMMIRLATPTGVAPWQPVAGMIGMVIFTIASVWAAGRIFRVGILMQGQPPKLGNIVRWALRG